MLVIEKISKTFNKGTATENMALRNLNLHLESGEYATLIGGNGSGKSTLLNCIAGVYTVDQGAIIVKQKDVTKYSEYKRAPLLGRVFQDPMVGTSGSLTIEENLALAARRGLGRGLAKGITGKDRKHFRTALAKLNLGLEDRLNCQVGLLSGGQRQALTLLMATLQRPEVLLLDEHTSALDPKTAEKVLELSDQVIKEHNLTCLMVTHNMRDAIKYGNRLIMMHNGEIILDIKGNAKEKLTVDYLLNRFSLASGGGFLADRALLA